MYRASAELVKYLAGKYDIPLDRQHILGHDKVPGTTPAAVPACTGTRARTGTGSTTSSCWARRSSRTRRAGRDVVTDPAGVRRATGRCTPAASTASVPCEPHGTNFVCLRTAPDATRHRWSRTSGSDPTGAASTTERGRHRTRAPPPASEYAVAERARRLDGDLVPGPEGLVREPARSSRRRCGRRGPVVTPKAGLARSPSTAGPTRRRRPTRRACPCRPSSPLQYTILAGQRYALQDATVSTDYYRATTFAGTPPTDHVDIRGQDAYYQVSLGHRTAYVRAADVDIVPAGDAETESTAERVQASASRRSSAADQRCSMAARSGPAGSWRSERASRRPRRRGGGRPATGGRRRPRARRPAPVRGGGSCARPHGCRRRRATARPYRRGGRRDPAGLGRRRWW